MSNPDQGTSSAGEGNNHDAARGWNGAVSAPGAAAAAAGGFPSSHARAHDDQSVQQAAGGFDYPNLPAYNITEPQFPNLADIPTGLGGSQTTGLEGDGLDAPGHTGTPVKSRGEKRKYRNPMATRAPAFTGAGEIKDPTAAEQQPACTNCSSTVTPMWRRGPDDELLCNACGLFFKLHKKQRPAALAKPRVNHLETVAGDAPVQRVECSNCQATQTPMWRKDPAGKLLCNACALYYKLHNAPRPPGTTQGGGKKRPRKDKKNSAGLEGGDANDPGLDSAAFALAAAAAAAAAAGAGSAGNGGQVSPTRTYEEGIPVPSWDPRKDPHSQDDNSHIHPAFRPGGGGSMAEGGDAGVDQQARVPQFDPALTTFDANGGVVFAGVDRQPDLGVDFDGEGDGRPKLSAEQQPAAA